MPPQTSDSEGAALAAVYRLLRELGKRRLATQAGADPTLDPDADVSSPASASLQGAQGSETPLCGSRGALT
jgi:hypothetical protein